MAKNLNRKNPHPQLDLSVPNSDALLPPSVTTDQADYAPGETATITAKGFKSGSTIRFAIADDPNDPGDDGNADIYPAFYVTDGGVGDLDGKVNGQVVTTWFVPTDNNGSGSGIPDAFHATLKLTATGVKAGKDGVFGTSDDITTSQIATTTFTDAGPAITLTGSTVTHDETAGLQNSSATSTVPGDANDNDILVSSLPSDFSNRLTALGAGTALGAARSGYTGVGGNTGSEVFTVSPVAGAVLTDLAFTDASGAALNGQQWVRDDLSTVAIEQIPVTTINGNSIFLYTDPGNNNILLGRAGSGTTPNPSGAIVFAAYLEQTALSGGVIGGKIWTVQYQALSHPNTTDPDDALDLSKQLYVGANQDLNFSLANAPSGQNLFMMFGNADAAIVVTGRKPANQSTGVNITTGDTVNTSQGGGTTTIGINNQLIDPTEGAYFTFVTGANSNYTVPNLDQNEADIEANIAFSNVLNARAATFTISQIQPGGQKASTLKLSARSTAPEPGVNFIDGLTGDTNVSITQVVVRNANGAVLVDTTTSLSGGGVTVSFSGGTATIAGVKAKYTVEYRTSADHNRVLIEHPGNSNANLNSSFDIGGFKLLQVSTATAEIGSKIFFEDAEPRISANSSLSADALVVDETVLPNNASANLAGNFSFTSAYGSDGAGSLSSSYALSVKSSGVASGLFDVATGEAVQLFLNATSGAVEGRISGGTIVFTVSVSSAGQVSLDQIRALRHLNPNDANDAVSLSAADLIT
ncbi:MAG: DUF5801 repeats-in-toxin domain-containing protein, partial [Synechococcales bacterium]|nr:DUF5801 repeats-in-toxin domain-containing protein [Synechococcales bacterium]